MIYKGLSYKAQQSSMVHSQHISHMNYGMMQCILVEIDRFEVKAWFFFSFLSSCWYKYEYQGKKHGMVKDNGLRLPDFRSLFWNQLVFLALDKSFSFCEPLFLHLLWELGCISRSLQALKLYGHILSFTHSFQKKFIEHLWCVFLYAKGSGNKARKR